MPAAAAWRIYRPSLSWTPFDRDSFFVLDFYVCYGVRRSTMLSILALVFTAHMANAKPKSPTKAVTLPSFKALAAAPISARKSYLLKVKTLIDKKPYKFLDPLVTAPTYDNRRRCSEAIYGHGNVVKKSETRLSCKQNINSAAAFFQFENNARAWEVFRLHVQLKCIESTACQSFLSTQAKFAQFESKKR